MKLNRVILFLISGLFILELHASSWENIEFEDNHGVSIEFDEEELKMIKGSKTIDINLEDKISGISHYKYNLISSNLHDNDYYYLIVSESAFRGYSVTGYCAEGTEKELFLIKVDNEFSKYYLEQVTLNSCYNKKNAAFEGDYIENNKAYFLVIKLKPSRNVEYSLDLKSLWKGYTKRVLDDNERPNPIYYRCRINEFNDSC